MAADDVGRASGDDRAPEGHALVVAPSGSGVAPFHPQPVAEPSSEYIEYVRIRPRILSIIRDNHQETSKVVDDIAKAILADDYAIPGGITGALQTIFTLGRNYARVRKGRQAEATYRKVAGALLERLFDPGLEFKLAKKSIIDAFQANGVKRTEVTDEQVSRIYVAVLDKLEVGELRDLTYEEDLHRYVLLKLREIKLSRMDWEVNGR
jgi:hypothetical protein